MEGSSKTYNTLSNCDPICVAKFIFWISQPDNIFTFLIIVKYSIPTLIKKSSLFNISFIIGV